MSAGRRTIVLVVLAAIVATVLATPTGAFGEETTLCLEDASPCPEEQVASHVHVATGEGNQATLLSSTLTVKCDVLFLGDSLGETGTPLVIHGAFTYSNCNFGCTATEENGPSEIEVLREGHETAKVTGEGLVHLECKGFINCRYNGAGLKATAKGPLLSSGETGEVSLQNQTLNKESGSLCPATNILDILLELLEPIYISSGEEGLPKASTTLTTSLKGGGKEGTEITVAEGSKVKDTASLSGENASEATGTVDYAVYKDKECKELVTEAGEVTVEEGIVPDSEEKELEAGKEYFWQARYLGDSMNSESTSTCSKEVLKVKANTSLATTLSGGGKEGAEITVAEGSKVKDTATLSGTNASTATGTVDYAVYKDKECKELVTEAGKGKVEGTKAASSEEKELEASAVYYWQAKYLGDSLHEASTSTCSKEVLTVKAKVSLSTKLSGGGKEGEEITVAEGSKVKDQATLSGTKSSTATGTLKYKVYKDKECKELATNAGEGEVKEGKAPASEEKELEAGKEYFWQAEYGGDSLHEASTSTCSKEVLKVKANTSLSTTLSGGGKEGAEITVAEGSKVKDTATLSGTNVSSATGTVDYSVYKDKECKELATKAGEGKVEGTKAASSEEKELEAGAVYYWQAKYLGDSLHEESTSTCSKEVLTVKAKVTLATKLVGGGKEGEEITVVEGSKVKDTATLSGTKSGTATGTIKYAVYKDKECKELATKAGEGEVKEGKAPNSEEKELEAAVYYWQAEYSGDNLHEASTSACSKEVLTVETTFKPHKTALCTADDPESICLEEHKPSTVDFKDSAAEFLTNLISTKCEGLISGSVGAAGKPQKVTGEYKFSSCTNGCVVTEVSGGSQLGFLFETSEKSTEELASATTEGLELFYKCGETVKCVYGPIKAVGDTLGALKTEDNGHITFSKDSLGEGEGIFCPEEASLDALFVAASAFYIREDYGTPPTSLCSKDEKSPFCKSENQLKTIDYKDKAVELLTNLINVKCEGLVSGTVGTPGPSTPLEVKAELTYTGCSGGCFVTSVAGPGKIMLQREGVAEEAKATSEGFEIFVKCGTTIKCLLGPEKIAGTALGALTTGDNGHLRWSKASMGKGEGTTCPKEATLDALYVASSAAYIG